MESSISIVRADIFCDILNYLVSSVPKCYILGPNALAYFPFPKLIGEGCEPTWRNFFPDYKFVCYEFISTVKALIAWNVCILWLKFLALRKTAFNILIDFRFWYCRVFLGERDQLFVDDFEMAVTWLVWNVGDADLASGASGIIRIWICCTLLVLNLCYGLQASSVIIL